MGYRCCNVSSPPRNPITFLKIFLCAQEQTESGYIALVKEQILRWVDPYDEGNMQVMKV